MHSGYEPRLSDGQLIAFMQAAVGRLGAEELLTTREVVRDFMDVLHMLHQHKELTFEELMGEREQEYLASGSSGNSGSKDELDDFLAEFDL
ncbi:hypothetical protein D3C73_1554720 [compost metagenome]